MADRSVSVRMIAEVDQYRRDMQSAATATGSIGQAAAQAGQQRTAIQQLGQAGREVGRGLAAAGGVAAAGVAAIGAAALRSGASYNVLEQQSRAALSTLLGSTEAAEAQMDDLREFVETRLFPREVFIDAQQQMLAFGFAAEQVIPALAAIEDGVAATGGTAQTFTEVVRILSRIQSTGQVTAESLNELARRGINAAELIGGAMGQTEAEIRDSITQGTLDGREAIEVLVTQMETRFEGGAEALTQTWVGASGLVAAGLRNIGSAATEAFVDPSGGGAAIQWANDVAEVLYAVHRQLEPLVAELRQRAAPGIERASEALQGLAETIDDLDLVALFDRVREGAPAFAALAAGVGAAGSAALLGAVPGFGALATAISPMGAAIAAAAAVSPELRGALLELLEALSPLLPAITDVGVALATALSSGLAQVVELLMPAIEAIALITDAFSSLPAPIQATTVALGAFALALRFGGTAGAALVGLAAIGAAVETLRHETVAAQIPVDGLAEDLQRLAERGRLTGEALRLFGQDSTDLADHIERATAASGSFIDRWTDPDFAFASKDDTDRAVDSIEKLNDALAGIAASGGDADAAFEALVERQGLTEDQVEELLALLPDYRREQERANERTRDAAEDQADMADETDRATTALQEQLEEIRAQADPMFALHRALRDLEEAQTAYNDVLEDAESTEADVTDASIALAEAALEVQGAVGEAAGTFDGELDPAFRATLESAGLTEEQIDRVEGSFRDATDAGDGFAKTYNAAVEVEGLDSALGRAMALERELGNLDGTRSSVHVDVTGAGGLVVPDFHTGGRVPGRRGGEVLANLAAEEHVWTPQEVQAAGGHAAVEAMRATVLAGESQFAAPAVGGGSALQMAGGSSGGQFTGALYLDSGAFLGMVHGQINEHDRGLVERVTAGTGASR